MSSGLGGLLPKALLQALYIQYIRRAIKLWRAALDLSLLFFGQILSEELAAVFVIVAVNAEIFPVGSIRGIIQVISVFVVDGQEMSRFFVEFPSTFGADEAVNLEGAFSIVTPWRLGFF